MTIEKKSIDITDRITGKFQEGQMKLFLEKEQIGQMISGAKGNEFELKNGYYFDNERFYQMADVTSQPDAKYVDCDYENGWC
ncbi:YusG family protein [Metabacillus arenae]|uniref:YusG family protein n=1 Tax=Metabacillus arenae TaxID=2771434 RepID=A0A926NHB4_9BACI|nr:YusG family protein [Metabacillus arenae]MBD1380790.1 YusG family protein [Metabacillus arenae]